MANVKIILVVFVVYDFNFIKYGYYNINFLMFVWNFFNAQELYWKNEHSIKKTKGFTLNPTENMLL